MVTGLNHITIAVSELERSLQFYINVLGLKGHVKWKEGAYLSAGELWFCLSRGPVFPSTDYSHIAFSLPEKCFEHMRFRIAELEVPVWKENISEGDSIYILDPDNHKLELHFGTLQSRLESLRSAPYQDCEWM